MKKATYLILIALTALSLSSCNMEDVITPRLTGTVFTGTPTGTGSTTTTPTTPATYYITFKADGVPISETVVTATRDLVANPRTLTITGTGAGGGNPKIKLFFEDSFIGFVPGLNVRHWITSYPSYFVDFTNSAGTTFSTKNDSDGIYSFFSAVSYTNGGVITGIFTGSMKTDAGVAVAITEGTFSVKFSN